MSENYLTNETAICASLTNCKKSFRFSRARQDMFTTLMKPLTVLHKPMYQM